MYGPLPLALVKGKVIAFFGVREVVREMGATGQWWFGGCQIRRLY
jgi:hypothetical protein